MTKSYYLMKTFPKVEPNTNTSSLVLKLLLISKIQSHNGMLFRKFSFTSCQVLLLDLTLVLYLSSIALKANISYFINVVSIEFRLQGRNYYRIIVRPSPGTVIIWYFYHCSPSTCSRGIEKAKDSKCCSK